MKVALSLLLVFASQWTSLAQGPLAKLEHVRLFGQDYVRLGDWASGFHFQTRWLKPAAELEVLSRWATLRFTVDSRKAEINGVNVWLSYAIAGHNGAAYITMLDLQTLLHPLLYPTKDEAPAQIKLICLDPGHGGKDPGEGDAGNQEKKFTLLLAREVRHFLVLAGVKAMLTRTHDSFVEKSRRTELANKAHADLFVSFHFNAASTDRTEVKGVEVYCLTPTGASSTNDRGEGSDYGPCPGNRQDARNILLAFQLQKSLVKSLPIEDRGLRRARFAILRSALMPAVLIEGGFMTHPEEAKRIYSPDQRREIARAIVDGLLEYKRLVER